MRLYQLLQISERYSIFLYNQLIMLEVKHFKSKTSTFTNLTAKNRPQVNKQSQHHNISLNLSDCQASASESLGSASFLKQESQSKNNDSRVSFQNNILSQHLQCLQFIISRLIKNLFNITQVFDQSILLNQNIYQEQQTLQGYFNQSHSLIPHQQVAFFINFMEGNHNFKKIIKWIYEKVHLHLGDELVLAAHRIVIAYLPVKYFCCEVEQIEAISNITFNLFNIFCDPALRLIGVATLSRYAQRNIKINDQLLTFYKSFLTTILLVLQEHFQNPYYADIINQKLEISQRASTYKCKKLNKKIVKIKKQ